MNEQIVTTFYAPPERASSEDLQRQRDSIGRQPLIRGLMDAVPEGIMILNRQRQVVMANLSLLKSLDLERDDEIVGLRPGEAMRCVHAHTGPAGCGTSEFCRTCGAAQAILESHERGRSVHECRITQADKNLERPMELLVWASDLELEGEKYSIFATKDISHEKRRRVLERLFFHDILNTAGGLRGLVELIREEASGRLADLASTVYEAANVLVQEIQAHRELMAAESGELNVDPFRLIQRMFLEDIAVRYQSHEAAKGKIIAVDPLTGSDDFTSDPSLLGRVIGNLLKNGLEASEVGETVRIGGRADECIAEFWVHNRAFLERDVELQIFQRSFSTKGKGRGLGTYSVKLLTEQYLGGSVSFSTFEKEGTTFRLKLPRHLTILPS